MRALVQRVSRASVTVDGERVARSAPACSCCSGSRTTTGPSDADRLAEKVRALRIFEDADGRMNEPLGEREILCVSQFTLYGDTRKGNRPAFVAAARPEQAEPLYERFCDAHRGPPRPLRRPHGRRAGQRRARDDASRASVTSASASACARPASRAP